MRFRYSKRFAPAVFLLPFAFLAFSLMNSADAEYGDVVINEFSDAAGMRPVVFPHWFHRIRFRCKYCGACHNGDVAWSIENCDLCHSGVPNTPTQVHHSTTQTVVTPSVQAPAPAATEATEPAAAGEQ